MGVTSIDKDLDNLTLTLVADFDALIERVWQLWADPRRPTFDTREQMDQLISMGAAEGTQQAIDQMDALLAA